MPNVTMFKRYSAINEPVVVKIEAVLDGIKSGKWKDKIEQLRASSNKEEVSNLKKELPCVCYAGEFTKPVLIEKEGREPYFSCRTDESLSKHSGLVPIDIDDIDNVDDIFNHLKEDQFIYALWRSASGRGVHGLIRIGDGNKHRLHYQALIKKYRVLDTTARNESRVLFVSYDPDIYINTKSSTYYDIEYLEEETPSAPSVFGDGFTDYKKIDVACKMIRMAPDGEKHNTLLKAAVLMGGYVAIGKVERVVAEELLFHEINKRQIVDAEAAKLTIKDGLNFGQMKPIQETESDFASAISEVEMHEGSLEFLSVNSADEDYIRRFRDGLIPMGLPLGYDELDKHLVLKEGEFYGVLAHGHIGKTTVTLWILFIAALQYDWNWFLYLGENSSASAKMRLIEFYCGRKIKDIPQLWFKAAMKWVNDHFYFAKDDRMYEYKELLHFAETLGRYKSLKGVFIDPYNSLKAATTASKSKYQYDYEAYTDMLTFTKRTKIALFLSVHTNTEAQRARDKDGNPVMPHASMAEGGSALYNKVDNFIIYHRKIKDQTDWMFTEISVDKVRNKETGGEPTKKGWPIRLRMQNAVEFTDEYGYLPFRRDYLPKYD